MDKDKAKYWKGRADNFMAEMVADTLDPQMVDGVENKIKEIFKGEGIPFRKTEMSAFSEGASFMLQAFLFDDDKGFHLSIVPILKMITQKMKNKVSKEVDEAMKDNGKE